MLETLRAAGAPPPPDSLAGRLAVRARAPIPLSAFGLDFRPFVLQPIGSQAKSRNPGKTRPPNDILHFSHTPEYIHNTLKRRLI